MMSGPQYTPRMRAKEASRRRSPASQRRQLRGKPRSRRLLAFPISAGRQVGKAATHGVSASRGPRAKSDADEESWLAPPDAAGQGAACANNWLDAGAP